jgi:methionyl-tRNA formyltransferase
MLQKKRAGRIVFIGAVHEARPALRSLLMSRSDVVALVTLDSTQGSPPAGYVDLASLAHRRGVPVLTTANVNDAQLVDAIAAARPDLIVCVGWTRLLGDRLLAIPKRGCVGFHASLLPHNRGRAPVNWAIIRGEQTTGNTMMMLASGVDNGDIVDQVPIAIETRDTCATVYGKVGQAGARMLRAHLPQLLDGTAPRRPQPPSSEPLLPKRTPEMGITAWNAPSYEVHNWIRALTHPYPGAFTFLGGRRIVLWHAENAARGPAGSPPGTICGADDRGVVVATKDGVVRIRFVQEEERRPCSALTWLRRARLAPGARFDSVDPATLAWARTGAPLAGSGVRR